MRPIEKGARLVNLLLAGMLTGNEFSGLLGIYPALDKIAPLARIEAEQAIYRRYGRIMPAYMSAALASFFPVLALDRDPASRSFRFTLAGLACYAAMLGITLTRNLSLNSRIVALPVEEGSVAEFAALRGRWDRLHAARNALNIAGFACTCLGALSRAAAGRGK
jgi:hypothetical protein